MRRLVAFVVAALAVCLANQSALAGKRVALVIGNSNYQNVAALTNPANDAAAITQMFEKASFDVVDSRRDLKYTEIRRALRDFTDKARGADIAVIYFAGHGLEVEMRFAHLKRILRLGRLRLRGPRGAQDEFVLAAIAQNLRRLASLVALPPPAHALRIA